MQNTEALAEQCLLKHKIPMVVYSVEALLLEIWLLTIKPPSPEVQKNDQSWKTTEMNRYSGWKLSKWILAYKKCNHCPHGDDLKPTQVRIREESPTNGQKVCQCRPQKQDDGSFSFIHVIFIHQVKYHICMKTNIWNLLKCLVCCRFGVFVSEYITNLCIRTFRTCWKLPIIKGIVRRPPFFLSTFWVVSIFSEFWFSIGLVLALGTCP